MLLNSSELIAKITDFGMSRTMDENVTEQATDTQVGPIAWMSPENLCKRHYSVKSDVWSFGVLLYEIFAREAPWKNKNIMMVAKKVMDGGHMQVNDAIVCRPLMLRCWAENPDQRISMDQIADELEEMMDEESS